VIDAHVYSLPRDLRDPAAALPDEDRTLREALHLHPEGPQALALSAPERILESMAEADIAVSVLVALPWSDPGLRRRNNDHVLEWAARTPAFHAVCAVRPGRPGWEAEAEAALDAGALGLKINPAWQGFALDGPESLSLAELVRERDAFLMTHVDHPFRHSAASPAALCALARQRPGTRILAAHLGGMVGLYTLHPPVAADLAHVWYDTAASGTLLMVRLLMEAGLGDRLVFGTDFPFNHSHSQAQPVRDLAALGLPAEGNRPLYEENFLRLAKAGGGR
jgi:predicted TIM-barrel fold metal-dependent hydrolase